MTEPSQKEHGTRRHGRRGPHTCPAEYRRTLMDTVGVEGAFEKRFR
jgi:hypothetical protein